MRPVHVISFAVAAALASAAQADHTVLSAGGSDADVIASVNAFRVQLGSGNANANVPGSFLTGRREINWDAVPDAQSAPNAFPGNFFNGPAAPRARGAEFLTPGAGFMISADDSNPTATPKDFANVDPSYLGMFREFSAQRMFTAIDSVTTEVVFFIPGQSRTRATVTAFGAVFSDVELPGVTRIDYFDRSNTLLASVPVPVAGQAQEGFSFAGAVFSGGEKVWRVVITSGNHALGAGIVDDPAAGVDLVVMDDFLYAEPVAMTEPEVFASGGSDDKILTAVGEFRDALGVLNPNQPGSHGSGRRQINWDAVPDTFASPNDLPLNFFNSNSPRGAVFSTPGTSVRVSADSSNPTNTPADFADLDASYAGLFRVFSPQRLFTAVGSTNVTTNFFVAGSPTPAVVTGFGAVFTDVELRTSARIDWFDQVGGLLASIYVPTGAVVDESFSFLGARFAEPYHVGSVVIQSGTSAVGPGVTENIAGGVDLVVMDDFIYGEPVKVPQVCAADRNADSLVDSQDFFDFIVAFFDNDADFNRDGVTDSQDFFEFLTAFFVGC